MNQDLNRYKLIVSDLDGTIFDKTYTLTEELSEVVAKAREQGCEFTFATGRLYPSAVQFAKALKLEVPIITYNGALIRNPVTGVTVNEVPVARDKVDEIIRITNDKPVMRFVFLNDVVYTDTDDETTNHYAKALKVKLLRVDSFDRILKKDPIMMALRADPEIIKDLTQQFKGHFADELYMANSRPFFLDIAHPKVSKGYALSFLSDWLGIKLSETIAIGDERNDIEMMRIAGLGAAVGNAQPIVKKEAGYVAKEKYWRGVIEVIRKYVLVER